METGRGSGRIPRAVALGAVGCALLTAPAAPAQGPTDPSCLAQGGTTGLLAVGGEIKTPDQLAGRPGGIGEPAPADVARTLPGAVVMRTSTETFGREYAFALRHGRIYVRPAKVGRGAAGEPWRVLKLPDCLAGHVTEISTDGRLLLALGPQRQLFAHDMPGGDLSAERWTWRWGPYFWSGQGIRMFGDVRAWAASEFTSSEHFTDTSGRERVPIGVATVYLLRGDRRRITYLDPWLPADESREVCGPRRGTLPLAGLSGSGSTVFVVGEGGELFTRLYDFDVSGANTVFGNYSWQDGRPADDSRWQMPGPGWIRHSRPPGEITDRISIAGTGLSSADRLLRVEGRDRRGRTGYWEQRIRARGRAGWTFVATGEPLSGHVLEAYGSRRRLAPNDRRYAGTIGGAPAELLDFNPECSPAKLRVHVAPGVGLDLVLHSSDGLRQETRARGLDDTPREYNGAVEIPRRVFDRLGSADPRLRGWVDANLAGHRITTTPIAVTSTRLRFLAQCWALTLDGGPARPDVPQVPADLGATDGGAKRRTAAASVLTGRATTAPVPRPRS
jgi:hypothetical protein